VISDPALRFWRHYAERQGALAEEEGAQTLMVLPASLQQRFGLNETIAITSDPALAREEGALLLIAGHPLLDEAAGEVLDEGDGGHLWLGWPPGPLPTAVSLRERARNAVGVDHGRIDPGGDPVPTYAPILRVGARATYSLHEQFNERDEVWVDAVSGLPLPAPLPRRLIGLPALEGRPPHPALEAELTTALAGAHRELMERTSRRMTELARQVVHFQEDEQSLAEAYYKTALESIDQRRQGAAPDRQRLLDAQAEATRAEWARRQQEIQQKFEPRWELSPFRLHLIWLPAMVLPVVIHRGQRSFPLTLVWWMQLDGFAPVACPSCGAAAPLVAARDRLACRICRPNPEPAPVPAPKRSSGSSKEHPPGREAPAAHQSPGSGGQPAGGLSEEDLLVSALEELRRQAKEDEARRQRIIRIGDKLGFSFWQSVVGHDPWPRKRAGQDTPLRIAYRLFGTDGPLRLLGMPASAVPYQSSSGTFDPEPGLPYCTDGLLVTRTGDFPFSLHWRMLAGKPVVEEVLPMLGAVDSRIAMNSITAASARELFRASSQLRVALDPVEELLWTLELPRSGLPLVLRCLASWSRIQEQPLPDAPIPVLAAALVAIVARRAGLNMTREGAATAYSADPQQVSALARLLQPLLGLSVHRWW
jgi:hypothetical protein